MIKTFLTKNGWQPAPFIIAIFHVSLRPISHLKRRVVGRHGGALPAVAAGIAAGIILNPSRCDSLFVFTVPCPISGHSTAAMGRWSRTGPTCQTASRCTYLCFGRLYFPHQLFVFVIGVFHFLFYFLFSFASIEPFAASHPQISSFFILKPPIFDNIVSFFGGMTISFFVHGCSRRRW